MAVREDMFKDEASSLIEELEQCIKDMREDGVCVTEDIRRIANELDEVWDGIVAKADTVEEEDLEAGEEVS